MKESNISASYRLILLLTPVVSLFTSGTLFTELGVGKVQGKRLEENARSHRHCRHVYPLLVGTAAVAADITQHNISAHNSSGLFQMKLVQAFHTSNLQPSEYLLMHMCRATSDLGYDTM